MNRNRFLCLLVISMFLSSFAAHAAINAKGGLAAGSGRVSVELTRSLNEKTDLKLDAGYGIGNNLSFISVSGGAIYKLTTAEAWNRYVGLEINYSDFSKKAVDVPGAGNIEKGGGVGFGLLAGLSTAKTFVQAGYNTRLGLMAEVGFRVRE